MKIRMIGFLGAILVTLACGRVVPVATPSRPGPQGKPPSPEPQNEVLPKVPVAKPDVTTSTPPKKPKAPTLSAGYRRLVAATSSLEKLDRWKRIVGVKFSSSDRVTYLTLSSDTISRLKLVAPILAAYTRELRKSGDPNYFEVIGFFERFVESLADGLSSRKMDGDSLERIFYVTFEYTKVRRAFYQTLSSLDDGEELSRENDQALRDIFSEMLVTFKLWKYTAKGKEAGTEHGKVLSAIEKIRAEGRFPLVLCSQIYQVEE